MYFPTQRRVSHAHTSTTSKTRASKLPLTCSWWAHAVLAAIILLTAWEFQGNITSQKQVTIFDPVHDIVREALDKRRVASFSPFAAPL